MEKREKKKKITNEIHKINVIIIFPTIVTFAIRRKSIVRTCQKILLSVRIPFGRTSRRNIPIGKVILRWMGTAFVNDQRNPRKICRKVTQNTEIQSIFYLDISSHSRISIVKGLLYFLYFLSINNKAVSEEKNYKHIIYINGLINRFKYNIHLNGESIFFDLVINY